MGRERERERKSYYGVVEIREEGGGRDGRWIRTAVFPLNDSIEENEKM